ncbi:exportin-5 isoform X1 [Maniola jurtina]|uniref:exportin-5 isoform X1 n=1 Tax=Maniola jurtina TaxID=191418 RepID=UPI001E687198|nr:exportin-5 isoform X1 [Maniola jurtina]XP_045764103.1 exportin-5 isoform X2 [Maniola jurtina]XP_045764104.1 exportin-5 isoform X1 [Maniola jurtina]XP_045764105.1 exportin-5 isoform X1 [Maniola jurtina]XP_045764106.1 exportin-5 isoform X1 [Maniola jurtina]
MNVGAFGEREVALIADELSNAVELTLNPTVAHEARKQAYTACESFKDNSPWCAQAGLLLASGPQYSPVVKHFGLQLMEHTVKYRWTHISQAEKIFIKENAMKLLNMGGWEIGHLNDALARVIVEMIKREWPQQWSTLLAELSDACSRGHLHTQIVLHVFLRLVEDVATLQTLEQHQRRKDIYQALTSNMAEIFAFFMRLIELHVQEFREKTAAGDYGAAASNGRVVQVVLLTLTGFVEWVSTNHVVSNNGRLLEILCILLSDDAFQLPAAECLLQIVNRKGSTKERKPLMILFSENAISYIHRAALQSIGAVDEPHYLFLKKLSQVLAGLAQQLTSLWNFATNTETWLPLLLETMLLLSSHPSLTLAHTANSMWLAFLKHEQISKLPHVLAMVPRWLQAAAPKVLKVTYPSSRVSGVNDAVSYACMDYDSEQEFAIFFNRCRTEILESFRYCMTAAPLVTWSYVEQWTQTALDKVDSCPLQLDVTHPLHVEWEALAQVLEVVLSRLLQAEPRPNVAEGLRLLQRCVATEPRAPLILSLLLSFISALFVFLSCAYSQLAGPGVGSAGAELLPRVLDKIFAALVYEGTASEDRSSRNVKNVRRHAASLLVRLGSKYPLLLLPVFGRLHELCQNTLARPDLSALESVTLQEALLLVSNHFCCYERQSALVAQVLGDCRERWAALSPHLQSAAGLARLVGLDSPASDDDPEKAQARRTLLHALTLTLGVVKRTQVPADPDKASRGGFSAGVTPSGNPVWRNPCGAHVLPLFPAALSLARALHELHSPQAASLRHPAHARALQPPPAERRNLLGLRDDAPPTPVATPQDRMQNLLHTLHENVCGLVGAAAASLGRELFGVANLAEALALSLLAAPETLPDHWLRRVLRAALRPLMLHCPPAHYADVALPLMRHLAPIMLVHLNQRWEYVTSLYESGKLEEEGGSESQEVLEDMLVRHLTREHLELLKVSLVEGGVSTEPCTDMEEETPPTNPGRAPEQVSELGAIILADPVAGPAVLHTILRALTWNDSTSSLRACALALPALRAAISAHEAGGCALGAGEAAGALAAVLHALRLHGQHEANQAALLALAVQTYEALRPRFPNVAAVLRAIPDVDAHDLQRLDEKLAANTNKPAKIDKSKRDLFKKITSRLIGRNVGQLFKKEVFILDLPTMNTPKEKPRSAVDSAEGAGLEKLFNTNAPT